jgi:nicotinate-nucleotide adenylyltransferase
MRIGLFFGSFNPVHIGHLIIAQYIQQYSDLDEVWMVVSPQNPFKQSKSLLPERQRFYMVQQAVEDIPGVKASDIEFGLAKPNYTILTLTHLKSLYPDDQFELIMGADNRNTLSKWRSGDYIIEHYPIWVYPRKGEERSELPPGTQWVEAPIMELSSTFIRKAIRSKKDIRFMLHPKTWEYIEHNNFFR